MYTREQNFHVVGMQIVSLPNVVGLFIAVRLTDRTYYALRSLFCFLISINRYNAETLVITGDFWHT